MVSIVSYFLIIPNLGSRCANIPAQYPTLVLQRPRHISEPRRSNDTLAVPSWRQGFKPKYAPVATGWLLRHVWLLNMYINVLHSNPWWPVQAGERPWRSEIIGVTTRKMSEHFCTRRYSQVGFLVRFGFTTKWASWNWSHKAVLDSSNCSGPSEPIFSLQIGS